jgi:hypothetical protein
VPVAFTFILVSIANTVKVKHAHCSAASLYHNRPHIYLPSSYDIYFSASLVQAAPALPMHH